MKLSRRISQQINLESSLTNSKRVLAPTEIHRHLRTDLGLPTTFLRTRAALNKNLKTSLDSRQQVALTLT